MTTYTATAIQQLRELVSDRTGTTDGDALLATYRTHYTRGWNASRNARARWERTEAYGHGYDDQACGLPKWTALAETGILG